MRFLSLFSGIEAASEAWTPLGWECAGVAEIDPFACAVLAHRHPHVPNLGDITKITEMQIAALGHIDLVVFGSPCQDLSIAGKQKGLSGERSGLFYPAVDIISWARLWCGARFALWENVPGAFSSNQGRDFAAVVGTLAGLDDVGVPPKGWGTEGCAVGSEAMVEWATLDAQWFGVAQRRRRIFALADFGNWAGRPPVLLEPEGVRGDSAPSREARQNAAGSLANRTTGGGFPGTDEACSRYVQPVRGPVTQAFGGNNQSGPIEQAATLNANRGCHNPGDFEAGTLLVQHVAHTLRGEGFDASEGGTGRGTPLVPVVAGGVHYAYYSHDYANDRITAVSGVNPALTASSTASGNLNVAVPVGVIAQNGSDVQAGFIHTVGTLSASQAKGTSGDVVAVPVCATGCVTHTLTAEGFDASEDGSGRGVPVVAFHSNAQADQLPGEGRDTSVSDPLTCSQSAAVAYSTNLHNTGANNAGKLFAEYTTCLDANSPSPALLTAMQVRRLTPVECERLQGFPDGHTDIPWTEYQRIQKRAAKAGSSFEAELKKHGKVLRGPNMPACPDGPRYKALGNSMAVPVMRWIGQKIDVALLFQE